jgi:hypothetical protein
MRPLRRLNSTLPEHGSAQSAKIDQKPRELDAIKLWAEKVFTQPQR